MYFNTSRTHRFAFGAVADAYADARLSFDVDLVAAVAGCAGLRPGDDVYEIGAGTGQLTRPLLDFGFSVTANEPSASMRAGLDPLASSRLEVRELPFEEDLVPSDRYSALFAANSFHWIRPEVALAKAHSIVGPGGALALIWNFGWPDTDVQAELNRSALVGHDDLIRDPALGIDAFAQVMAVGRQRLLESGHFGPPRSGWRTLSRTLSARRYADLVVSQASAAALTAPRRAELRANVLASLQRAGVEEVALTEHIYVCVALGVGR